MMTVTICMAVAASVLLLGVAGVVPRRSGRSRYQQRQLDDARDRLLLQRDARLLDVLSLQRVLCGLLLVTIATLLIASFDWLVGSLISLFIALEYGAIARLPLLQRRSQALYQRYEPSILAFLTRHRWMRAVIRSAIPEFNLEPPIRSRDELIHTITQTKSILTPDQKSQLLSGLDFETRLVCDIMTPRHLIKSIDKKELLGPLVLDDLHKTGHSRFPVTDGGIDHVIGMLYVQNLMSLDSKKSTTVEKAMEPRVFYLHQDQTLAHALAAFLRSHHLLFIIVDSTQQTVGILSLEDTIEALMGRKIADEFDGHEDVHAVAKRYPVGSHKIKKSQDA